MRTLVFACDVRDEHRESARAALATLIEAGVPIWNPDFVQIGDHGEVLASSGPLFAVHGKEGEPKSWVFYLLDEVSEEEYLEAARRMFPDLRIEKRDPA